MGEFAIKNYQLCASKFIFLDLAGISFYVVLNDDLGLIFTISIDNVLIHNMIADMFRNFFVTFFLQKRRLASFYLVHALEV